MENPAKSKGVMYAQLNSMYEAAAECTRSSSRSDLWRGSGMCVDPRLESDAALRCDERPLGGRESGGILSSSSHTRIVASVQGGEG